MANIVEIPPPQDDTHLLLAEQPPQQPPPADQLNNQAIDENNDVAQAEDVLIFVPSLMNVVDQPQLMMQESLILSFQLLLPEVCSW